MSTADPTPRWWQRLLQHLAASRGGSWFFSRTIHHVDPLLLRLSSGRVAIPAVLAGLPTIRLTTIGAKTGRERTVPVLGLQDGDSWVVFASNWGGDRHPSWYHNLQATPTVEVNYHGEQSTYRARDATPPERDRYWPRAKRLYVGFTAYEQRTDREIPIVVLEPGEA